MSDYQIDYKISKKAKVTLVILFLIFWGGVIIKALSLRIKPNFFDFSILVVFLIFLIFSTAAIWSFLFKKNPIVAISSKNLLVSVPYFFQVKSVKLSEIREVKISVWGRSEIIFQDGPDLRSYSFMSPFLSSEDRDSFLSNIFDLLPNTNVK